MDSLLSLAFENISSGDLSKIRKGLRQIEGILAQICLSSPGAESPSKRRASLLQPSSTTSPSKAKTLADLPSDPAFLTFFHLQDTFSHNLCSRLITTLERLLGHPNSTITTSLLLSTLTLLHGILLLHPPSRSLFATETAMNLLLDLLEPTSSPQIQAAALAVLSSALLSSPTNARLFDSTTDGLITVASLYKAPSTDPFVLAKIEEFFAAYMLPEVPATGVSQSEPGTAVRASPRKDGAVGLERRASTLNGDEGGGCGDGTSLWDNGVRGTVTRSRVEKKRLLGRYIGDIDGLLEGMEGIGVTDSVG